MIFFIWNKSEMDDFIANVQDAFAKLTADNLVEQATMLVSMANDSTFRLEAIVNILLQSIVKIASKCSSRLLSSLVSRIFVKCDASDHFQEYVRQKSIHVLRYLLSAATQQRQPSSFPPLVGGFGGSVVSSLDREVMGIEYISHHWGIVRRRRFSHFIAELFAANIISYTDIFDLKQSNPNLASDLILKNDFDPLHCCDLDMSPTANDIIRDESYRCAREIENYLFCLRIEVNVDGVHRFVCDAQ